MLQGMNLKKAVPYIPEVERGNLENPFVAWIFPQNIEGVNSSVETYQKTRDKKRTGEETFNAKKTTEADIQDFVTICDKIENYQFSENYSDLAKKGTLIEVSDKATLRLFVLDVDFFILKEIQNAASNWTELNKGITAYENYKKLSATKP